MHGHRGSSRQHFPVGLPLGVKSKGNVRQQPASRRVMYSVTLFYIEPLNAVAWLRQPLTVNQYALVTA